MRKALLTFLLLFVFLLTYSQSGIPRQLYPGVFEAMQLTNIFLDNKIFVDTISKHDPEPVMKDHGAQKNEPGR